MLKLALISAVFFSAVLQAASFEKTAQRTLSLDIAAVILKGSSGVQVSQSYLRPGWFFGSEWQGIGISGTTNKVTKSLSAVDECVLFFSTSFENMFRPLLGPLPLFPVLKTGLSYLQKKERGGTQYGVAFYTSPELHVSLPTFWVISPEVFGAYAVSLGQVTFYRFIAGGRLAFQW